VSQIVTRQMDSDGRVVMVVGVTPDYVQALARTGASDLVDPGRFGPRVSGTGGLLLVAAADDAELLDRFGRVFARSDTLVDEDSREAWRDGAAA
jgi:hypothetical protein